MGFNEFMTKLFGNKSQRDLKEITPYVDKVKAVYPSIKALSNDELRAKTDEIKQRIQDYVAEEKAQVEELRKGIEDKELEEREAIWAEVDKIEKAITDKMEVVLEQSLPEVFAIMKDTARRFAENEEVVVTANQFDRDLAARFDFVRIEDDKAIYANHWKAGGNEITWDMIHYDVQLFGGVVLHKGKIAEMATGEGKTLVATLPVFLNALTRNGVHVVTVNDYLSKRDSEISTSRIPRLAVRLMRRISRSVRTTSSVSTTCATIWRSARKTWYNASITTPSSMRWTPY